MLVRPTITNQNLSVGWGSFKDITAAQKASEKVTDYCGSVIYENGVLKMILTPEGYITLNGTTPTYHYYLRDHLGNNRVVVNQSGTVEQVNHYYPFGGVFGEGTATSTQPYKYNDKELDRTNGLDLYDYSARYMDAALGQFTTVDPMAEKYYSISPYVYVGNNPVRKLDPDGRDEYEFNGKQWVKISDIGRSMGLHFFHMGVTNAEGKEITNIMDQEGNWAEMSGGREILKDAVIRGEDVNWETITDEFTNGTGPEKSMFEGNHPANPAIQEHYLYQNAGSEFEGLEKDNAYIKVNWGPKDVIKTGTSNKQAQMMGSYSVSFYKVGDKTLSFIYDSKSKTSLFYHLPVTNKDRQEGGSNRLKTTRQLYMFFNQ